MSSRMFSATLFGGGYLLIDKGSANNATFMTAVVLTWRLMDEPPLG
jgi:hypothetical protein